MTHILARLADYWAPGRHLPVSPVRESDSCYHVVFLHWCWGSKSGSSSLCTSMLQPFAQPSTMETIAMPPKTLTPGSSSVSLSPCSVLHEETVASFFNCSQSSFSLFQSIWESDKASLYSKVTDRLTEQRKAFIHFQFQWTSLLCKQDLALSTTGHTPPPPPVSCDAGYGKKTGRK